MKTVSTKTKPAKQGVSEKSGTAVRLNAHIDPADLTTIVAVFTSGRTGSSLMSSLLDSHPWIAATPDCVLMGFYVFWEEFCDLKRDALIGTFIDQFRSLFDGAAPPKNSKSWACYGGRIGFTNMGENRDQTLSAHVDVFRSSMREMLPRGKTVIRRVFLQALHVAYADAIGHRLEKGAIISMGLHSTSRPGVTALTEDFINVRLLHMVREPIQTLGSHFRHKQVAGDLNSRTPWMMVRNRFLSGSQALENVKFRSRAVRLEDLHQAPKRTMSAVCGWLGIPWDDALLHSTFNGLKFWNDKTSAHQVSGFSKEIIAQKHEAYISRFDRFRYTVIFARRFQAFDYFLHNTFLCQRIVLAMLLPSFVFPFRTEMLANKGGWRLGSLKYFIKLRLLVLHYTLSPPDTVPVLRPNIIES
ncbi:MAG: sulfotransferase [Alphaproteobacteria bacterium]|jgi:hypothetical protein|nr:sulfotransferase [Alphaproteobacteria bacterium]